MARTWQSVGPLTISETDFLNLRQESSNSPNHCQTRGQETILPANFCGAAHHHFTITAKLKQRNRAGISFTNAEFVSENYAKQNGGCAF